MNDDYGLILKRISDQKTQIQEHLCMGGAKTFDEYTSMVGEYRGLLKIEQEILDLQKKAIED
jgi:hypothetical protein|tara:strand:- start:199 stop:384 length:186 start_codon:yes stop_codon:yes gene_type:complete